jgi:dTDP-glucose 4,6-dehydratase/UDP-glucose 4-epimerase
MGRDELRHDGLCLFHDEIDAVVRRFGPGWAALRGARLFITGGTGYFGRWLLRVLARADETLGLDLKVTALSRAPERFLAAEPDLARRAALRFVAGDVRDYAFPDGDFSHLIHAAATSAAATFANSEDALTKFDISLAGTRRSLDFAAQRGIGRVLMLSSGSFYGALRPEYDAYPEDYPFAPTPTNIEASVGHAKRAAEFLCACYADRHGLSYSTARCFSFVGPGLPLDIHYAIGNFIRDALWRDAICVGGDGSPVRAYLYTGDLMVWLLTLLTRGENGRAYNVGSDQALSIAALARRIGRLLAPAKEVRILGAHPGTVTRNLYLPDIRRAREELGLDLWTSLDEAILRTAHCA